MNFIEKYRNQQEIGNASLVIFTTKRNLCLLSSLLFYIFDLLFYQISSHVFYNRHNYTYTTAYIRNVSY